MNLAFSTQWPERMDHLSGSQTYFIDQIWTALKETRDLDYFTWCEYFDRHYQKFGQDKTAAAFENDPKLQQKLHTIRKDENDRWIPGKQIHFMIHPRTSDRFQFAPVIKCISTQQIQIDHFWDVIELSIDGKLSRAHTNSAGKIFSWDMAIADLAKNDGFKSVQDFFSWFNEDFKGKIIHWTKFKY